jgi:hypothetical protein
LAAGRGADLLIGGAGDDTLIGGRGADTLVGGDGVDVADYTLSLEGVTIDMADGTAGSGDAQGDSFSGIEIVQGSYHDDVLRGDAGDNRLRGGRGADLLDGRDGFDIADYRRGEQAVHVDLSLGRGLAGEAEGDTLIGIEMLLGSVHHDTLVGGAGDDVFDGDFGNDQILGGMGSDTYRVGYDSAADVITEIGDEADIDRVAMRAELSNKDVSLLRQGDDLLIELEKDDGYLIDTVRVKDHFLARATGIEEIVFTNGVVWDRARMEELVRAGRFNAEDDIHMWGVEDVVAVIDPADLIANDAELGLDKLDLIGLGKFRNGTASIRADGMIEFRGAANHNGHAYFDYTVRDEFGRESTATVKVNIEPRNDAPTAVDDMSITGNEDVPLRIRIETLLANDYDIDGDFEHLRIVGIAPLRSTDGGELHRYKEQGWDAGSHVMGRVDGDYLELRVRPDHFGFAGFLYRLADASGAISTAKVELLIRPVNDAPRSHGRNRSIRLEQTAALSVADLMAPVYDIEGDAVSFVGLHGGADNNPAGNGSVAFDPATGAIQFTPASLGGASLQYEVIDARGASSILTYNFTVRPLNDAPKARNDYGYRTLEDTILVIDPAALLANDRDENGDTLILTGIERFADNGKIRINDAGLIEFSPRSDFNGSAGFEYYISDGRGGTSKAYVSITIMPRNDGPILRGDVIAGLEDGDIYAIPAEAFGNDIEPDGDVLFFKRASVVGVLDSKYLSAGIEVTARLASGAALPEWLRFDARDLRFTGTFPAEQAPVVVDIWVRDPETGGIFNRRFTIDAQADLDRSLSGQALDGYVIRQRFESGLEFGAGRLGQGTAVAATLADGSGLPDWLRFDETTLRFTGTPPADVTEPFETVLIFTRPGANGPVSFADRVTIAPQTLAAGLAYDSDVALFDVAKGSFSASLASGRPLPDWLAVDLQTMTVKRTGFEPGDEAGPVRLQIIFTPDPANLPSGVRASTDRGFTLEFVIDPHAPIDPAINALLANQPFFASQGLFALDLGAAGGISAKRESGAPLNSWLSFDAETLTFSGMPPASFVGAVPVRLDLTGNGGRLPTMSVITEAVVDRTYKVGSSGGFSVSTSGERVTLDTPKDFHGSVAVAYHATDEKGGVSAKPAIIVFNVKPQSEKPDGGGDLLAVRENGTVTVALAELLANDFDRDGDAVRIVEVKQPARGKVVLNLATVSIAPPPELAPVEGAVWSAQIGTGAPLPTWMTVDPATGRISATVAAGRARQLRPAFHQDGRARGRHRRCGAAVRRQCRRHGHLHARSVLLGR